jgi:hypothetical protein
MEIILRAREDAEEIQETAKEVWGYPEPPALPKADEDESEEEAAARIASKYAAMERLAYRAIHLEIPSLIVSGPPGMSKTYTVDDELGKSERKLHDGFSHHEDASKLYDRISGGCTGPGLFQSLFHMRNGGLVIIDDCDSVFEDIQTLNMIKIATDTKKKRIVSWRKQAAWLAQYNIERSFEFKGSLIFLTNIDFELVIKKQGKDIEHFKALIDRARYLCLTIRTHRDFMIRIRHVCAGPEGLLQRIHKISPDDSEMILNYIDANKTRFYNLSIRLVEQIAGDFVTDRAQWLADTENTKTKTTL